LRYNPVVAGYQRENLLLNRAVEGAEIKLTEVEKVDNKVWVHVEPMTVPGRLSVLTGNALELKTFLVGDPLIPLRARGATIGKDEEVIVTDDTKELDVAKGRTFSDVPAVRIKNTG
jgi:hypothetical protein